jgi:exodeoxyribonuclease VII large subunit
VIGLARSRLEGSERALVTALRSELRIKRSDFQRVAGRLNAGPIAQRSQECGARLADLGQRLEAGYARRLGDLAERLSRQEQLLASYSYQRTLERGFALVLDDGQHPVTHKGEVRPGQHVTLRFADGQTGAVIEGAPRPSGARSAKPSPTQESLF